MQSTRALLITVNYKSADVTLEFLDRLCKLNRFSELDIIVVDSASADDSVSRIQTHIDGLGAVRVLECTENRGYFGAAKWGLGRYCAEKDAVPEWIIVCNNDILIKDVQFLEKLFARDPSSVAVIAPRIVSLRTHLDQNPFMKTRPGRWKLLEIRLRLSTYYTALLHNVMSQLFRSVLSGMRGWPLRGKTFEPKVPQRIYAPHGAFVIFSRTYFESGGWIDDQLFLYGEEISTAEICRSRNLTVLYDPELTVFHQEGQTIGRAYSRSSYFAGKETLRYFLSHYFHK